MRTIDKKVYDSLIDFLKKHCPDTLCCECDVYIDGRCRHESRPKGKLVIETPEEVKS